MKHLLLLSVLLAVLLHDAHAGGCLQNKTNIKRYVHYVGEALDLTIDTSRRISHRLVSNVIKIILEEVLGYQSVKILPETQKNTSTIFRGFPYAKSPVAMVNLEVLLTPDVKVNKQYDNHAAKDSGVIARSGRYGWFVPEELTSRAPAADQWTFFKSNQAGVFDLKDQDDINLIQNTSINSSTSRFYCEETYCNHGTFEPSQCHNLNNECALLLTSYPDSTGFVVDHIKALKLNVKVVWLGPNLANVVRALNRKFSNIQNSNQSLIFLEWTPEYSGMADLKVARVTMPNCETVPSFLALGCKYEMTRIVKLTWNRLRDLAKPAYNMIDDISFSAKEYQELIQYYNKTNDFESAACYWMKDHVVKWTNWTAGTTKEILYIAGIYPMSVKSYNGFSIASAANMAVQAINDNTEVLRDYTLQHLISDGKCQADLVMKSFIDYVNSDSHKRMIGLLGPACSEAVEPLVGVARHYNVVAISYSAEGTSFTDRKKYPYFFRTIGENKQFTYVYSYLFNLMNWKRVAALSEDGQKYTEYISFMGNEFKKNKNSTLQLIENIKFPRERKDDVMDGYLASLQEMSARVIIADVADSVARQLMCQAYHRRMTAAQGYTWFLPSWFSPDWYNTNITSSTPHNNSNTQKRCSVDQMIEAINGHFSISQAQFADDDDLMQENITVGQWRHQYKAQPRILPGISPYIGYAYDAVWTYALAFDKLIKQHPEALSTIHTQSTAQKLTDLIGDLDFNGVSGNIKFRRGSSRYSVINIFQWINKTNVLVGSFTPKVDDNEPIILGGKLKFNESKVVWLTPDGKRPNDGEVQPSCAFGPLANLLQISCDGALIVFNIFIFLVLGIIILVSFFYIKRRYDRRIQETKKFMMTLGLDVLAASKFSTLDKWEIPRDRVVINRKLGEGAFGTVYGGEANFPEGRGWTAVAVKTLKVGSDTEEKLDFLSEAEAMKRFEHKNIVKLLAVCTKTEPVYAIMEFMLYGDLKTYLLARRHLVNEKYTEESEDISNKKLTSMALDVARALSYLADLKYVHRDVACRNCLVNSNRVVKLGDFGMTRLIFESDYYKFSRKGMLPVRWMSPESLGLGIFSPASDVWSYGVLLYEIITFGSFPFQGYSNNQVLEYVKKGNTITIPKGVKPQLEGLIKSCWKVDHKARPQASEIVEFLANSPRLLSPCLDVPLSSVQRDNSDELPELPAPLLPDHLRKCSVSVAEGTPSLECRPPVAPTAPLKLSNGIAKHLVVPSVVSSSATNPTYMSADFGDTSSFDDAFDNTPVFNRKPIKIGFKSNDFREEEVSFV